MKVKLEQKNKNNQGQSVMEYIILSSLIGIFCLVTIKQYGDVLQNRIEYMKRQVVEHIKGSSN